MSRRRQEGGCRGAGLLPHPPTGDQTQDLLYLEKSSITKIYPPDNLPFWKQDPTTYLSLSLLSLTVLLPQPQEQL